MGWGAVDTFQVCQTKFGLGMTSFFRDVDHRQVEVDLNGDGARDEYVMVVEEQVQFACRVNPSCALWWLSENSRIDMSGLKLSGVPNMELLRSLLMGEELPDSGEFDALGEFLEYGLGRQQCSPWKGVLNPDGESSAESRSASVRLVISDLMSTLHARGVLVDESSLTGKPLRLPKIKGEVEEGDTVVLKGGKRYEAVSIDYSGAVSLDGDRVLMNRENIRIVGREEGGSCRIAIDPSKVRKVERRKVAPIQYSLDHPKWLNDPVPYESPKNPVEFKTQLPSMDQILQDYFPAPQLPSFVEGGRQSVPDLGTPQLDEDDAAERARRAVKKLVEDTKAAKDSDRKGAVIFSW
ncbi:MAG: hypothetical protein JXA24_00920 [Proteobacteria bacterium]|nr:hypothetical protein [Pseudomonadota bacterium]